MSISVIKPADWQTFQRDGNGKANIPIQGTYTGSPTAIQARFNGGSWTTIDTAPTGGSFSGTLSNQDQGQGLLECRFSNDVGETDLVTWVGIGDIFVVAGQSNAEGRATNAQSFTHPTLRASVFRQDDQWREGNDPTDISTINGSVWPLLATRFMADQNVPVAFITTARGATLLTGGTWSKPGYDYDDCVQTIQHSEVNGVKAILWHQGESDALANINAAAYETALRLMLDNLQADTGFAMPLVCANLGYQSSVGTTRSNLDAIRQAQLSAIANDPDIYGGPILHDIHHADTIHFQSNTEMQTLAGRWWRILKHLFYGGTEGNAPKVIGAMRLEDKVTVTLTGGVSPLNLNTTTGWRFTDNGTSIPILSANPLNPYQVELTLAGIPTGSEILTFASFNDAVNTTLLDSGVYPMPPEPAFIPVVEIVIIMPTLVQLGPGNCVESLPNGDNGDIMQMVAGSPTWVAPLDGGVSADALNILLAGSDNRAYLSCETVQDCIGTAVANGVGLTYNDLTNAISVSGVPITSGAGAPAATTNSPTFYTNTNNGDIYYRDPSGATLLLYSVLSCEVVQDCIGTAIANGTGLTYNDALNAISATGIPITTGSGAPPATANSPTIYTNTVTGDVYYRDATGTSVIISSIFELTAGPNGTTVGSGPFSVGNADVLHLFGATVGFTVTAGKIQAEVEISTDANNNLTTGSDGKLYASSSVGSLTTTADEKATFAAGTLNIPNPLPVARIVRTSKIALTAAFSGAQSSGTQDGNTLTYVWTAPAQNGTTGTATIATPNAATTTMTFNTPGEYDVTLTVTDLNGNTASAVYTIKVDRVLNVNGIDDGDDLFRTLQAAFTWITTNDAGQASNYLIEVIKTPSDTSRITPNAAKVWISSRAVIPVGIDFPSGTFFWAGAGNQSQIAVTSGSAFTCVNGTVLAMDMVNISSADATADIVVTSGGTLVFVNCTFSGSAVELTFVDTTVTFRNCSITARIVATSTPNTNSLIIQGSVLSVVSTAGLLDVNNVTLAITGCQFTCTNGTAIKNRTSSGYINGCRILTAGTGTNADFPAVDLDSPLTSRIFQFSNNYVSNTGINGSNISSVLKLVPGSVGALRIAHNTFIAGRYGIHAVGTLTGVVRILNNVIEGGSLAALISTSDAAATTPLTWSNASFVNNSILGSVSNITFKTTTDLLEGNRQYS